MASTPFMNLQLPTQGADEGTWGTELNTALNTLDQHNHSPGQGAPIPTSGLFINAELDMHGNRTVNQSQVQFVNQSAAATGVANAGSLQEVNGNLYFVNAQGVAVQLTTGTTLAPVAVAPTYALGMVFAFAGVSAPTGFLLCDGSAVSRSTYSGLFAAIGPTYGAGDGSTTFNLPDLRGRTTVGAGTYTDPVSGTTTRTLAAKVGAEAHVLTTAQMPSHNHATASAGDHVHSTNYSTNDGGFSDGRPVYNGNNGGRPTVQYNSNTAGAHTHTISNTGGDTAHNNMQPSLVMNYIIYAVN